MVLQRGQKPSSGKKAGSSHAGSGAKPNEGATGATGATGVAGATGATGATGAAGANNNVAPPPQLAAGQAGALAAELASSAASVQALSFYRIPLFLLPIYQAAAHQYGVPWQILAAINEIETNYGTDQSVSTAGAVGWMQFMPATWASYGVDAFKAGYADPYNPVDAIFAAARYLRAAGAAQNLRGAILAYNHSDEYAESVLLRAKLISTYPQSVIATLTGLVNDRLPATGHPLSWGSVHSSETPGQGRLTGSRPPTPSAKPAGTSPALKRRLAPAAAAAAATGNGEPGQDTQADRPAERPPRRRRGGAGRAHPEARQLSQARQLRDPARPLRRRVHLRGARQHRFELPPARPRRTRR